MTTEIKPSVCSKAARRAAKSLGSSIAILITVNRAGDRWESRIWGETPALAYLAGLAADNVLPAVNNTVFPDDVLAGVSSAPIKPTELLS